MRAILIVLLCLLGRVPAWATDCRDFGPVTVAVIGGGNVFRWQTRPDGVDFVDKGVWRFPCAKLDSSISESTVTITAFRFDRSKFEFVLVDPRTESEKIDKTLSKGGMFVTSTKQFYRFGSNIATIGRIGKDAAKYSLLAPAGWWLNVDPVEPDGFLKIDGEEISTTFAKNQSAVVCLHDETLGHGDHDNVIAVWYYYNKGRYSYSNWTTRETAGASKKERLQKCKNVFQTTPRIVESRKDREELLNDKILSFSDGIQCLAKEDHTQAGIYDHINRQNADLPSKRQRVVLAADSRIGQQRRYYVVYFHTELSFYQIQAILLSDAFYGDAKPEWAVNLAGGERAGLLARGGKVPIEYGNVESDLPSILAVRRIP